MKHYGLYRTLNSGKKEYKFEMRDECPELVRITVWKSSNNKWKNYSQLKIADARLMYRELLSNGYEKIVDAG
jgi:hypothetical protein